MLILLNNLKSAGSFMAHSTVKRLVKFIVICAGFLFVAKCTLWFMPSGRKLSYLASMVRANNNARSISHSLQSFREQYGRFPDDKTADAIPARYSGPKEYIVGLCSNQYFRQMLEVKSANDAAIFQFSDGSKIGFDLKNHSAPENVEFAYFLDGEGRGSTEPPGRVVVAAPFIPGYPPRLDSNRFRGKAVVVFADLRTKTVPIQHDGNPWLGEVAPTSSDLPGDSNWGHNGRPIIKLPALPAKK
ncbi:MAG: hypothetical protein WCP45_06440 [Verrucomicrobiota bacterium]